MSKYDKDREKLGIKTNSNSTSTAVMEKKKPSKYDQDREEMLKPESKKQVVAPAYDYTQHKPQELQSPAHNNLPKGTKPDYTKDIAITPPKVSNYEDRKNLPSRKIPLLGMVLSDLDKISDSKPQQIIAKLGKMLYTPGGTAANIAGFTSSVGQKAATVAPKLASSLAGNMVGRVTQKVLKEGSVGFPLGVGQYQATGGDDTKEALKQGAIGAAFGGGLGALGGVAGEAITTLRQLKAAKAGPSYDGVDLTSNVGGKPKPINPLQTNPEEYVKAFKKFTDTEDIHGGLKEIVNHLNDLNGQYKQAIDEQYTFLKESLKERQGVNQGGVIKDANGEVIDRYGRTSNNPDWYQQFYKENNRVPTNKELRELAQKHVDEGFTDSGYAIPSWKTQNNYDETVSSLESVKAELDNSLSEIKGKPLNEPDFYKTGDPSLKLPETNPAEPATVPDVKPVSKYDAEREVIKQAETTKTDLQLKLDDLQKDYAAKKDIISTGGLHPEDKIKKLKGLAMEHSAKKREAIQGDLLIPVDGGLTAKELTDKLNKLKSNYAGKEVNVNGQDGVIKNVAFGKVTVTFADGTQKSFDPAMVKPKADIDEVIKKQLEPVVPPKVEPLPEPAAVEPVKPIDTPRPEPAPTSKYANERIEIASKERGFVTTLKESEKTSKSLKERLKGKYEPITNEDTVALANERVKNIEKAASYVLGDERFSEEKVATAGRLIDEFSKSGNYERAADIAESIAEQGTKGGQAIQAFAIYNRLTPEGVLIHAQRIAKKTNESLNILQKDVKVTSEMTKDILDLAHTTRAMTGVKDLSNNVLDIIEQTKTGAKLTDEDTEALQKFVNDSKQFIKEVEKKPTIKPPKEVIDKRAKDKVIKFLDAQEEAAKERMRARGKRMSSTPVDIYLDYAIIGAAKMARGTIKFSEWSAAMIKDLGEDIRPMLESIYNRSSEAMNMSAKKVTKNSLSNVEKIVNKLIKDGKISKEDSEYVKTLAEKVSDLSGDAKNVASQDLQFILRQLEKPTLLKRVSSIQTIAQLLNPKTQVRNALGNELFYRLERLNKYIAAPIDWGRVQLFGGKRSVTFRTNNQGEYWKNWLMGLKAGWRGVNVEGLQTQFDLGPAAFNGKWNPLTYMEKALGASLKSFDTAAYKRAVNNTIGEMATLRAMNEGLTGEAKKAAIQKYIRNVDDHVLKISDDYGKYMTFQDNNLLSKGLVGLKRGMNFGKEFGLGDLVLKYPKTPGALLMRALEYSPAGFLRSASIAAKPFFKKEPNTAEAMQALSRAILGTAGLSGLGFYLADVGILTGAASKDKDVRDLQRSAGQGQYQVNLSALRRWAMSGFDPKEAKTKESDYLYTYDWAQPIAMAVSVGANVNQNLKDGKNASSGLGGTIYNSIEGGVNSLVETSVLSGVKRAFTTYPNESVTDKITDIVASAPASFVPTAANQTKQLTDNAQRETYDPDKLTQAYNQLRVKIPGMSTQLPQRYDTLGSKKETYQKNSLFNVLVNPGFTSKYKLTPEAKMVVQLIDETGDTSVAPRVPGKTITVYDDNGVASTQKLTTEQFTKLQQLTGEETVRLLKLIDPSFTNEMKLRAIADMLTDAGKKARYDLKTMMGVK